MNSAFMNGALFTAYFVAGMFFLRYWVVSRDRLFAMFSAAFALLAMQRLLLAFVPPDAALLLYLVRVSAFVVIIIAIIDKNRANR